MSRAAAKAKAERLALIKRRARKFARTYSVQAVGSLPCLQCNGGGMIAPNADAADDVDMDFCSCSAGITMQREGRNS